ncbi:NAD(P)-dependent oxidoreductase [Rhizobium ruizarguesonis]|uniref:NAD(P)-dependent oxidoreductase n=1 Tax=Rhizobium TaxID=379 RepID=UPI0013E0D465|nr:NAD(P)-dependent oxidoreductase [Rhizobium ruizarguesonis]
MKVGYIGLGAMGGSLSRHLIADGELVVYDRDPATLTAFEKLGAVIADTPQALAQSCDVVMLCLPKSADVGDLLFGSDGIAGHLRAGGLVIDQTSGVPELTIDFARRLAERKVLFMDAPVSGGIPAAQNRTVTIIASGSNDAWERGKPILERLSTKTLRCGQRVGDGQALKLLTNGIGACYRLATLELVALWRKSGFPLADFVTALNRSVGANFTSRNMLVGLVEGRSTTNFAMALMVKDLNGALDLGTQTASTLPLTTTARGLMQSAIGLFGEEARLDDVIAFTEKLSSCRLADELHDNRQSHETPVSTGNLDELLARAVAACNVVAVLEAVEVGRKLGLAVADIARVIESGSAWSHIAAELLSSVEADALDIGRYQVEHEALEHAAQLAAQIGLPFIMPGIALARFRDRVALTTQDHHQAQAVHLP